LQEEINRNQSVHEQEVQMRLEFESKLNGLHSLHRDLEIKYERAVAEIHTLEMTREAQRGLMEKNQNEVLRLTQLKYSYEATIKSQSTKVDSLEMQLKQRQQDQSDLEKKNRQQLEQIDVSNSKMREAVFEAQQLKLQKASEAKLIETLRDNLKMKESSLQEVKEQKEEFREKLAQAHQRLEEKLRECEDTKQQLESIAALKENRDRRIKQLNEEIGDL
jgi:chromosome segregation ATPase